MISRPLRSVELFSGAGGLALGVAAAGFEHQLLLEYNRDACKTLRLNQAAFGHNCEIYEGDVRAFDFVPFEGIDLLAAGAPCQPFSIAGKHKTHQDERNLFPQVFRAVRDIQPRAVIVENVRGLLRPSLAEFVEFIELQLSFPFVLPRDPSDPDGWRKHLPTLRAAKAGRKPTSDLRYSVRKILVNAANFGVPQRRERVFFVAIQEGVGEWSAPEANFSEAALKLAQEVTGSYWREHGMDRRSRSGHPLAGKWAREAGRTDRWRTVRDALSGLPEPSTKGDGDWPNHILQPGARSYAGHTGSPLDAPAKTLKAGVHGVPGGENMLRRTNRTVRYFSVREAARIQTFPDDYVFTGAWGEAMRQIGNAVPVRLAERVAQSVRDSLQRVESQHRQIAAPRLEPEQVDLLELIASP